MIREPQVDLSLKTKCLRQKLFNKVEKTHPLLNDMILQAYHTQDSVIVQMKSIENLKG